MRQMYMYVDQQKDMYVACKISRPVVLLHVPLPGLGRERVENLGSAQIFYGSSRNGEKLTFSCPAGRN